MAMLQNRKQIVITDSEMDKILENYFSKKSAETKRGTFEYDAIDLAGRVIATSETLTDTKIALEKLEKEIAETKRDARSIKTLSIVGFTTLSFMFLVFIILYMFGY